MRRVSFVVLMAGLLVAAPWLGAHAQTAVFQEGISDAGGSNPEYEHDHTMIVNTSESGSGWGAGAMAFTDIGNRWNRPPGQYGWALMRYPLDSLSAEGNVTITGARVVLTTLRADLMTVPDADDLPDEFPAQLTFNLYQMKEPNWDWVEGSGTSEGGNSFGEVKWNVMQDDVLTWPIGDSADAHLWPENHPMAPDRDAYNVYGTPIATGQTTGTLASYWRVDGNEDLNGQEVVLEFNGDGLAYLQSVLDGTISDGPGCDAYDLGCGDAGMFLEPPQEILALSGEERFFRVRVASDEYADEPAIRPRLEVDYIIEADPDPDPDPDPMPVAGAVAIGTLLAALGSAGYVAARRRRQ